ncbi:NACHT domain-containing protein [Actinomadura luteofluorescens]
MDLLVISSSSRRLTVVRGLKFVGRTLGGASFLVAAGVAVNQIYDNGKLSWSWGYLALVFTVLGALTQAVPQSAPPVPEMAPPPPPAGGRRKGSRRAYLRRMRSAVDQMETIGLVTQAEYVLRTRQVYVDVMLRPRPVTEAVTDTGIGSVSFPETGRRASLASFLGPGRVLAVLGAAGSGKTTLARHTALEIAERRRGWRRRRQLPVLLYLRDHGKAIAAGEPEGLAQIAVTAPWLGGAVSAEWLEERLRRGRCVILLDGLDEVADSQDRSRVVQWVEDQISRYPANAFVVTSRPVGYDANRLSRADVLQVQRFTGQQIRAFLRAWYRAIEHRSREGDPKEIDRLAAQAADDLFQRIGSEPALFDLAANPLLLTMIANVHRYRGSLPGSRVALYEEVCQVLLHRRQEAKRLTDPGMDGLSGEKRERVVQELAWYMMRRELRDIPVEDAERAIRTVLERTAPDIAPGAFLFSVKRSGLLLEHQYGRFGFAHLTLQEYLASTLVSAHTSRRQLLVDNVGNPWWREVTLLWAARADAGPIVEACLADRTVTTLSLAYACAEEARELDPELRTRLDRLLRSAPDDPEEMRLLDGVVAARALHDTRVLDNGTRICTNPVSQDLWWRFVARTRARHVPTSVDGDLWTRGIKDFLAWLNGLFGDGTGYRMPTLAEARQALDLDLYAAGGRRVIFRRSTRLALYAADKDWADDHGQVHLVSDSPAGFPQRPNTRELSRYSALIVQQTHVLFRLFQSAAPVTLVDLLAFGRSRDLARAEDRLLQALDLASDAELGLTREPFLTTARERAFERAVGLGFEDLPAQAVDLDLDRVRGRALNCASGIAHELGLDFGRWLRASPGGDGDSTAPASVLLAFLPRLSREILRAHPLAHGLGHPLPLNRRHGSDATIERSLGPFDQALVHDLCHDLAEAHDHVDRLLRVPDDHLRDIAVDFRQSLSWLGHPRDVASSPFYNRRLAFQFRDLLADASIDRILHIDHFSGSFLTRAGHLLGTAPETEPQPVSSTAHDFCLVLQRVRHHAFALAQARDPRASAPDVPEQDYAHVLTLARLVFAGALGRLDMSAVVSTAWACLSLWQSFEATTAEPTQDRRPPRRPTTLKAFLHQELLATIGSPARDPGMALNSTLSRALMIGQKEVADLIRNAIRLTAPLLEQGRRGRQSEMVLAVTSLLAAALLNKGEDEILAQHLSGSLTALVALTPDSDMYWPTRQSGKLLVLAQV